MRDTRIERGSRCAADEGSNRRSCYDAAGTCHNAQNPAQNSADRRAAPARDIFGLVKMEMAVLVFFYYNGVNDVYALVAFCGLQFFEPILCRLRARIGGDEDLDDVVRHKYPVSDCPELVVIMPFNWQGTKFVDGSFLLLYTWHMPTVSMFDGIKILMYYRDHLPPHFHVERGDESAEVGIDPILILEGRLSRATRARVFEWAAIHQGQLRANWELARARAALLQIEPLD